MRRSISFVFAASLLLPIAAARAGIFQWEYINPLDPSQGKQQSTTLVPDGAGVDAVPGANLSNRNLTMAYLVRKDLTNSNLSQANLTNADFTSATLTGVNFTDAIVRGARFYAIHGGSGEQLYSTASYKARDLTGIDLGGNDLSGGNLVGQNLTNAVFANARLTGVNLTGAVVRGANFDSCSGVFCGGASGITAAQLYSTASYQAHDLTGISLHRNNLAGANLAGQNLTNANLTNANLQTATLTRANFSQANLTNADLTGANLTGASLNEAVLTDAIVKNAKLSSTRITLDQLYSTASYRNHDLGSVHFFGNDLSGGNFAGQNLAFADFYAAKLVGADFTNANLSLAELINADLSQANLTGANLTHGSLALANLSGANLTNANLSGTNLIGANLTGAELRGANLSRLVIVIPGGGGNTPFKSGCGGSSRFFPGMPSTSYVVGTGITVKQLESTAAYGARDLSGVSLLNNSFNGVDFAGFNLTNANFTGTTLAGADLSGADARGASGLGGIAAPNFIRPDGHIAGLNLTAGQTLDIRDYDGTPSSELIPIHVDEQLTMAPGAMLRMILEADAWDSTMSFTNGIPVSLDGNLELLFADGTDLTGQVGRTLQLFDWTGVSPTGTFAIDSSYVWDLSNLFTSGEVTLIAIPEPNAFFLLSLGLVVAWKRRRTFPIHTFGTPLASVRRIVPVLALLLVSGNRSLADLPEIQLTEIGAPIWKPVDFHLFSAPATPFNTEFGQVYTTLLPYDTQPATSYTPHAPPYDSEFTAGMIAGGYIDQSLFTEDAITLQPNGVYLVFMMVPDPGITGSSRDFASGPVIPNSLFPIASNVDVWLDGVLVDRVPGADAIIPVQPKDIPFQGTSHLESLQVVWHPWDDDLTVGPLGDYELRVSLRDNGGSGWDIVAPFQVVPGLPGDFNHDGAVDSADYVVWRKGLGTTYTQDHFNQWRANFGATLGGGALAPSAKTPSPTVPEPSSFMLVAAALLGRVHHRPRRTP
jgi:uncharacterized protein YjbI with pentapeptide repeats